jgi:hypothetical protein
MKFGAHFQHSAALSSHSPFFSALSIKISLVNIRYVLQVLHYSAAELHEATKLSLAAVSDVFLTVARRVAPRAASPLTRKRLRCHRNGEDGVRLQDDVIDDMLAGMGLPLGMLTELCGESSSGKTQLALQLALAVQLPKALGGLEGGASALSVHVCVCVCVAVCVRLCGYGSLKGACMCVVARVSCPLHCTYTLRPLSFAQLTPPWSPTSLQAPSTLIRKLRFPHPDWKSWRRRIAAALATGSAHGT